jgi:hypothetical protein
MKNLDMLISKQGSNNCDITITQQNPKTIYKIKLRINVSKIVFSIK